MKECYLIRHIASGRFLAKSGYRTVSPFTCNPKKIDIYQSKEAVKRSIDNLFRIYDISYRHVVVDVFETVKKESYQIDKPDS